MIFIFKVETFFLQSPWKKEAKSLTALKAYFDATETLSIQAKNT